MRFLIGVLLLAILAVRLVALDADPPQWLSWSMGLQTDEGFYTLDARHESLFGTLAPGNFHDRLLSPLLSVLQQCVFRLFGVGTIPARLIGVAFGLLSVLAFGYGLWQAFGKRIALWGTMLLGLAPPVVFYNRLALQETPTVFWLVLAFALWASSQSATGRRRDRILLVLSGICLALAVIFKALAIIALPAFLAVWWKGDLRPSLCGLGLTLGLYLVLWYSPHHAELARMGTYYRLHQFEPHTAESVWLNVRRGMVEGERGILPYFLRLLPIPCLLVGISFRRPWTASRVFLVAWLGFGLAFCLLSSYAPDRYYMLFYPALLGLAAWGASRLPQWMQIVGVGLFLVTSGYWYGRAWAGREYARRDAGGSLARTLPAGSVLAGEMAPSLCLDTSFAAVPVQPGLSNDVRPVESLHLTHVLVTRATNQQRWWLAHAPTVVQPSHLVMTLPLHDRNNDLVDVYAVLGRKR